MPSTDAYAALRTFLEGDAGDVRTAVNAEIAALLPAGSVNVTRAGRSRAGRRDKAPPIAVELVPQTPEPVRQIGIGFVERGQAFDAEVTIRLKATADGAAQLDQVEDVQRVLLFHYHGRSDLNIPGVNFRWSTAEPVAIDEVPESSNYARSVTRITFSYTEAQEANT